jgi:hypothetical protein
MSIRREDVLHQVHRRRMNGVDAERPRRYGGHETVAGDLSRRCLPSRKTTARGGSSPSCGGCTRIMILSEFCGHARGGIPVTVILFPQVLPVQRVGTSRIHLASRRTSRAESLKKTRLPGLTDSTGLFIILLKLHKLEVSFRLARG